MATSKTNEEEVEEEDEDLGASGAAAVVAVVVVSASEDLRFLERRRLELRPGMVTKRCCSTVVYEVRWGVGVVRLLLQHSTM